MAFPVVVGRAAAAQSRAQRLRMAATLANSSSSPAALGPQGDPRKPTSYRQACTPISAGYLLTVKYHAICCKPVVVLFWSRGLPARSLAPVLTTAL